MKKKLFYAAIVIAVLFIVLGVYYLIPGIYHYVGYSNHRSVTMTAHRLYSGALFVLAVICLAIALLVRPKQAKIA